MYYFLVHFKIYDIIIFSVQFFYCSDQFIVVVVLEETASSTEGDTDNEDLDDGEEEEEMEEDGQSYTETEIETTETEDEDELKSNRLDQLIYKTFFSNKCNVQVKYTWLTYTKWFLTFTFTYCSFTHFFSHCRLFLKNTIYAQNQNTLYSFLSCFCCLSSVMCARLTIPWWRQVNLGLKLLLKQHVLCARKKTHGTASQPCLDLESPLAISCYVWPFLLQGALPVKSCRYSLTWAWGVFH